MINSLSESLTPCFIDKYVSFLYSYDSIVYITERNCTLKKKLREKIFESLASVLPITAIVLILSITIAPVAAETLVLFLFGALLLIFGMGVFTLGADLAMTPMGEGMGIEMSKSRQAVWPIFSGFVFGIIITMAEPDLQVLAEQVPAIPNLVIILAVAAGVSLFMMLAIARMFFIIPLNFLLFLFYGIIFFAAVFTPPSFIPVSFDSGGVTTGPVTVPFIMSMGVGLAALQSDRHSGEDSFGLRRILYFLVPGYFLSLLLTFFVPKIYTGIAFDSGGVASGPMTAAFLLPCAMGACEAAGGNILTDAFGVVAMTPLITIKDPTSQTPGFHRGTPKRKRYHKAL